MAGKWMQAESEREEEAGTKGSFSKKAARAGESTAEYAREKKSAPGKLGKQARLAATFAKFRPKGRKGGGHVGGKKVGKKAKAGFPVKAKGAEKPMPGAKKAAGFGK